MGQYYLIMGLMLWAMAFGVKKMAGVFVGGGRAGSLARKGAFQLVSRMFR